MARLRLCHALVATLLLSCCLADKPVTGGYEVQPAQPEGKQLLIRSCSFCIVCDSADETPVTFGSGFMASLGILWF